MPSPPIRIAILGLRSSASATEVLRIEIGGRRPSAPIFGIAPCLRRLTQRRVHAPDAETGTRRSAVLRHLDDQRARRRSNRFERRLWSPRVHRARPLRARSAAPSAGFCRGLGRDLDCSDRDGFAAEGIVDQCGPRHRPRSAGRDPASTGASLPAAGDGGRLSIPRGAAQIVPPPTRPRKRSEAANSIRGR